jgi:outer membrane biosynthesis protein TonB
MTRTVILSCLFAVLSLVAITQDDESILVSTNIPKYPPLARVGQVEGIVKLTFTLSAHAGEPTDIQVVSGHPLLKNAAVENVKTWHLQNPYDISRKYETTFKYRLGPGPPAISSFESFHNVEIVSFIPYLD